MITKLKKNYQFSNVFRQGKSQVVGELSIHYKKNNLDINRLGFTTVKNFGSVVKKNRRRRLLRESYRALGDHIEPGYDIILMGRISKSKSDFHTTKSCMEKALKKAGLWVD